MVQGDSAPAETGGLVIERIFQAPREVVWRAWTEAERFARWYGPQGFTVPTCQIDPRVGGRLLTCMRSPDGKDFWYTGAFKEVDPPARFVHTESLADANGNVVRNHRCYEHSSSLHGHFDSGDGDQRAVMR